MYAVDGQRVQDLAHLSSLLDNASDDFVTIMMERGGIIVMDRARVARISSRVLSRYQVAADRSPRLAAPATQTH